MDNPTISLDSLYSLLIDASFEKLDVAQLDDFRKILVALLEEFSTQCKDNHLPTKKLDLLRTALNLLDLTAKSQNSTSGVLIESTSRDPASIPTPATSLHGQSDLSAKRAIPVLPPPYTSGSSSGCTGCPIVSAPVSARERRFGQIPDASSLGSFIQHRHLMLDQPQKFETVQNKVFERFSVNRTRFRNDAAVIKKAILFFADAFRTGGASQLESFIEFARSNADTNFETVGEGAQQTKSSILDPLVISRAVKLYEKCTWARNRFTVDLPATVRNSLQFIHLADFFSAYQQCQLDLSDMSSELHRTVKHEGVVTSRVLDECLIRKTQKIKATTLTKRLAKTIKKSWNEELNVSQVCRTVEKAFTKGMLILLPDTSIKLFGTMRPEVLEFLVETFAKEIPDIKTVCEQVTDNIVDPFLRGQKPGFARQEAKDAMGGDGFVLAGLVQGHPSGSPESFAPRSVPRSFVRDHTPLSSTSHRNMSSASLPGKKHESDRDYSEVNEHETEEEEDMTEVEDWAVIGAKGLREMYDEDLTEEEDWEAIGAEGLRERYRPK